MSELPSANASEPRATARAVAFPLRAALLLVLLASWPTAWAQWREADAESARGRPFWMLPHYPELVRRLDAAQLPDADGELVLWSGHAGREHRLRLFGLQFHAVPRPVRDVRREADALAALRDGRPVLVDLATDAQTHAAVARLASLSGAREPSAAAGEAPDDARGTARLLLPPERAP